MPVSPPLWEEREGGSEVREENLHCGVNAVPSPALNKLEGGIFSFLLMGNGLLSCYPEDNAP